MLMVRIDLGRDVRESHSNAFFGTHENRVTRNRSFFLTASGYAGE